MRPWLALIALGTVLGAAGAGVVVGHAAATRPTPSSETSLVEQRLESIGQQIADAHRLGALDFSQAHAIDRELFEVRGREHRLKSHDHGALAQLDADSLQSQLDQLADELRYAADARRAPKLVVGPDWDPSRA